MYAKVGTKTSQQLKHNKLRELEEKNRQLNKKFIKIFWHSKKNGKKIKLIKNTRTCDTKKCFRKKRMLLNLVATLYLCKSSCCISDVIASFCQAIYASCVIHDLHIKREFKCHIQLLFYISVFDVE